MTADLTSDCIQDLSRKLDKKASETELRTLFCRFCYNPGCSLSSAASDKWVARIKTQEDRLLVHPNMARPGDPRWEHLRAVDFVDVDTHTISVAVNSAGSWDAPVSDSPDTGAVRFVDVESKTQKGTFYKVGLDVTGAAVSCTCAAGSRKRKCAHLKWAQSLAVEDPPEAPEGLRANGEERSLQDGDVVPRQHLPPDFPRARNTYVPPEGIALGPISPPSQAGPHRPRDPWSDSGSTVVTRSGLRATTGKRRGDGE